MQVVLNKFVRTERFSVAEFFYEVLGIPMEDTTCLSQIFPARAERVMKLS